MDARGYLSVHLFKVELIEAEARSSHLSIAAGSAPAAVAVTETSASGVSAARSVPTASTEPATPACRGTIRHGTCFIDYDCPSQKLPTVAGRYGLLSIFIIPNFRETEASRFAGKAIPYDTDSVRRYSGPCEPILQL
jgi:hypothetical protein